MKTCRKCPIRTKCTQVVPGIGSFTTSLMIVGEAPGFDEDKKGEPFVGLCGQLLNKLLEKAGIQRKDVYITNLVKCRPPVNRNPLPEEIQNCKPWLWAEIQKIKPAAILTLGKFSSCTLLKKKTTTTMKSIISQFHEVDYMDSLVAPWYHPSYLLRNGKKLDQMTVDWFVKVKEKVNELKQHPSI